MKARNVVIVDGVRSAFSRGGKGKLEATRMDELGAKIVVALLERNPKVKPTMIHEFGIGIGHPIGATGNRLVFTVAKELRRSGKRYGLATQCIGGGQGAATIVEALD